MKHFAFMRSSRPESSEAFPLLLTEGGDNLLLTEGGDPLMLTEGVASTPMEIGLLGTPAVTGTGTTTVGPYTPVANSRLLAFALYRRGGSINQVTKATITTELPWVERADAVQALASPTSARATCWTAVADSNPKPVSTTFDSANGNVIWGVICQIPDSLLDFSNVGGDIDTNGDPAPVLAAAALDDSLLIAGCAVTLNENLGQQPPDPYLTTPPGFTNLFNGARAIGTSQNPLAVQVCYRIAKGANGAAWNSAGFISASVIIEVKHV